MEGKSRCIPVVLLCLVLSACASSAGCLSCRLCPQAAAVGVPRELEKMSLPAYVIEPPDILLIDAVRVIPLPPYRIEPMDALLIQSSEALPNEPINGIFAVEPDGTVNLGVSYGAVRVVGLTIDEARAAIEKQLKVVLKGPKVLLALAQSRALQQIRGEHLVRPDGTVGLGTYGSAYVAGLTLEEAKTAIEAQLSVHLYRPEIALDVYAYNSKVFYVIMDGAGYGQQVYRFPITGNETVLDAISQVNGLSPVSSKHKIWVARPAQPCSCEQQVMAVNWKALSQCGDPATNYQLYPGDRIYVQSDALIRFDNVIAKIVAPIERVLGVTLLGQQTILSFDRGIQGGRGGAGF